MRERLARWERYARSVMRVMLAFTFSLHGWQKLFGLVGGHAMPFPSLLWTAGVLETIGGALMLLGLGTRPVAFVLSGEMAFAYFHVHAPRGFWPIQNGGELAVVYCFAWLYLAFAGGGPWSLDRLLGLEKR